MTWFALLSTLSATQLILIFNRLCLGFFPFVIGSFLSLPFPFGCTHRTKPMPPVLKPPATSTAGNVFLLCYWLAYHFRPSEFEFIEQIEAVRFAQVSAPVLLAYLPAPAFSQRPPAQKR
jgi:hypothetical protein